MKSHKLCVYLFLAILNVDASHKHFILPKEVNPLEYDISIRPNLTLGVYKGKVIITVNVTKNIDSITLHSKNLKINYAKINTVRANIQEDTECDFITLKKHTDIKKGIYNITINFEGDMKNKTYGFYRGYEIEYDREVYFGATFLEPTNARRAFPCFDEPQLKAKFSIHILRPLHYVALSNMDQIGETLEPHRRINIHFRQTPPIPTHLVTFFVGKYGFVEDYYVKKNNKTVIPTRIYTPLSNMGNMEFAAHEIPKLLKWFVKYTGYDYMFPKLGLDFYHLNLDKQHEIFLRVIVNFKHNMQVYSKMFVICVVIFFLNSFYFETFGQSRTNFLIKRFYFCPSQKIIKFSGNITHDDKLQYLDFDMTLPFPLDDNIGVTCDVETGINEKTFVPLFIIREKRFCKAVHNYFGEVGYDIERAAQMLPGYCPMQQGRYHLHHYPLNLSNIPLQTFPFGFLRFTAKLLDKRNAKILECYVMEVDNMPHFDILHYYITINSKFHIGGMEHWGATTTREESIRYNETMSILDTRSAKTIAHELAHIWFGNLVTVASWGEFWLTEGFVRFMDIKVNDLYKEQNEKISLSSSILHTALWRDDDVTALPLVRKIKNPIDVYDILDNINSNKGGSILRMTEQVIGEKLMQKVVHTYLTNNKYGSITSKHFIQVLQSFVTFNATDFLDGFLKQSGFPMIVAKLNKDAQSVTLIKERFLRFGQPHAEGSWTVPIWYITNIDRKPKFVWFPSNKTRMNLKLDKKISWIKLNYQQGSYYRTHYCYEMWHKLIGVIQDLTVEDRINLLDDAGAILRSGKLPCSLTLRATKYLYNENRVEVWETAQDIFGKIRIGFLQNNMSIENLNLYIADLIDRQYKKYSWTSAKNETFATKAARATIFNLACYYGHEGCRRMVMKLWPKRETLSVDIKNILLANNPYRKINYSRTNVKNIQELGVWFGADFSKLSPEPVFHWPKGIMQNCEKWLKNRPNFHIV